MCLGDVASLVAYLAYHYRLRCELLCIHTSQHLLPSIAAEVSASLTFILAAADRLEVMVRGSECRRLFNTVKQRALKYLTTADKFGERFELHGDLDDIGDRVAFELSDVLPMELVDFFSYLQNVNAVIGITMHGDAPDWDAGNIYMNTTATLSPGAWSQEYMQVNDSLRELVRQSLTRALSEEEVGQLYSLSVWQSENFLSHFRPHVFDLSGYSPNLTSLAKRHSLSLCLLVSERYEESSMACCSSDEEGVPRSAVGEETEKQDRNKDVLGTESGLGNSDQAVEDGISGVTYQDGQEYRENVGEMEDLAERRETSDDAVKAILSEDHLDDIESAVLTAMPFSQLQAARRQVELWREKQDCLVLSVQTEIEQLRSVMQSSKASVVLRTLDSKLQSKRTELHSATKKLDMIAVVENQVTCLVEQGLKQSSPQRLHVLPVAGLLSRTLISSRGQLSVLLELVGCVTMLLSETDCYNACCCMT